MDARDRRARIAVAALFLTNGALFANLLPRYPEIKADLGLSNSAYGLAVAAFATGALISGPFAATLIRRFTSARVAIAASLVIAVCTLLAGIAPAAALFAGALLVGGAADAVTDVAQNAHGLRVQRHYQRSIINSLHAVWSAGAILGGAMGAAAIALDISRGVHLTASAVLFGTIACVACPFLLAGPDEPADDHGAVAHSGPPPRKLLTYAVLGALVLLSIASATIEDSGSTWATLFVGELGAPGAIAVFGFIAATGSQFVGRVVGDRMVDRFGQRAVGRVGGLIAALGMGTALAFPTVPSVIAGFAAAGFGAATLIPAAMHAADELPGLKHGTGLTLVTWLMRLGFVATPPLVGAIADATSLRVGLLAVPVAGLVVWALAGVLAGRRTR